MGKRFEKSGFCFCSLLETVENGLQPFENGLLPLTKQMDFSTHCFEFFIDKNGLKIVFDYLENEKETSGNCIESQVNFQAFSENELIEKALFFVSVIKWKKVESALHYETVLNTLW